MGRKSRLKKQRKEFSVFMDGKPYAYEHPMYSVMYKIWREACVTGFSVYGRGALYRDTSVGLGKAGYVPLRKIEDPVGTQVVETYNPAKEFVIAEPNDKGGTRWQLLQK